MPSIRKLHREYRRISQGVELSNGRLFTIDVEYRSWGSPSQWLYHVFECDLAPGLDAWFARPNGLGCASSPENGYASAQLAIDAAKAWLEQNGDQQRGDDDAR